MTGPLRALLRPLGGFTTVRRRPGQHLIECTFALAFSQLILPDTVNPPVNPARSLESDQRVDDHVTRICGAPVRIATPARPSGRGIPDSALSPGRCPATS